MKLPRGVLIALSEKSEKKYKVQYLCDVIAKRKKISAARAEALGELCRKLELNVPKELWMFGTSEQLKTALSVSPFHRKACERRKGGRKQTGAPRKIRSSEDRQA